MKITAFDQVKAELTIQLTKDEHSAALNNLIEAAAVIGQSSAIISHVIQRVENILNCLNLDLADNTYYGSVTVTDMNNINALVSAQPGALSMLGWITVLNY